MADGDEVYITNTELQNVGTQLARITDLLEVLVRHHVPDALCRECGSVKRTLSGRMCDPCFERDKLNRPIDNVARPQSAQAGMDVSASDRFASSTLTPATLNRPTDSKLVDKDSD